MRAPFAPPRLSEPRNVDADAQAVETSCEIDSPDARIWPLSFVDVLVVDQLVVDGRDRVLPDELLLRDLRAEVARARAHVAVGELEPRPGERVGELIRMLHEAPRDLLVRRVEPEREVGGQHVRRDLLRLVVGIRNRAGARATLRPPLMRTGGALGQLPLEAEQVLEEVVAPLRRRGGPGDLEAAGDRVTGDSPCRSGSSSRCPASSMSPPSGSSPTCSLGPAPWVLPKVWPPAISATVSSSFIAMRRKVSRMSTAASTGSGLPFGPSGLT